MTPRCFANADADADADARDHGRVSGLEKSHLYAEAHFSYSLSQNRQLPQNCLSSSQSQHQQQLQQIKTATDLATLSLTSVF